MKNRTKWWKLSFLLVFLLFLFGGCSGRDNEINSLADVNQASFRLGVVQGSASHLTAQEKFPNAKLCFFNTVPEGCEAVEAGKVDGFSFDDTTLEYHARQNPETVVMEERIGSSGAYAGMKLGNTELCEKVNDFIALAQSDGTLEDMEERWLKSSNPEMPELEMAKNPVGTLRVVSEGVTEPFDYIGANGEKIGFDMELAARLGNYLNMEVEAETLAFDALFAAVDYGRADIILCQLNATPERENHVLFSDPYLVSAMGILVQSQRYTDTGGNSGAASSLVEDLKESFVATFVTEGRWELILKGLGITVFIAVLSFIFGTLLGAVLCLMEKSSSRPLNRVAWVYNQIVSGIPVLVWLMILYYIIFRGVNIPAIAVAIIVFSMDMGASLSGLFRTGVDSVDKGQLESAAAMGFTPVGVFFHVTLPQAANCILRLYKGQFISLVKGTSIVGYITIMDLTKVNDIIRSQTYSAFFPLITTALIYFIVTYLLIHLLSRVEYRIDPKRRKRQLKGVDISDKG